MVGVSVGVSVMAIQAASKKDGSRDVLIPRLVDVFRQYGYDGASLACIAQATGVGKTNLYHYFPGGKQEMAEVALAHVQHWLETAILEPLALQASPQTKLQNMCEQVSQFFREGHNSCLWAVLALGQSSDDLFHQDIRQALSSWITALAHVLEQAEYGVAEAKQTAEDIVLRIQGALVLAKGLGDTAPFQRTLNSIAGMLQGKA
jgi:TetR/AcrR family transcriptional regulator, lmrAB and yxaGH operons repressor